ncbi:hypothetical protein [Pseudopedobacter sp.]|uniref:hypothetical protein n=1 Tax=Pseudopedobacter sp. TaxID=1936787 RepID=UPI003342E186
MKYESNQTGWLFIILISATVIVITFSYYLQLGDNPLSMNSLRLALFVFILILINFYKLKIRVDDTGINILYGIGLIHIKIQPDAMVSVQTVKTSWLSGFGIRITFNGMLYNIQGRDAVRINYFQDGKSKTLTIGSKEPDKLKVFLERKYKVG